MLYKFIPAFLDYGLITSLFLLSLMGFLFFLVIRFIITKDKNLLTLYRNICGFGFVLFHIFSLYLLFPYWRDKPDLNWLNALNYICFPMVIYVFSLFIGIKNILTFKKSKKVSFLVWSILLCFVSAVGFGLDLFKVLQMFNVIA